MKTRTISYVNALNEAQDEILTQDPDAYIIGLGVPGPTGIFGSTSGLLEKHGPNRVLDMPASEGGMTGVALGTAISGCRPIMVHMRMDFAVLSMETLVNQAAKWHYMYGGVMRAPMTIRMIIGRGWGQGPQHSQSLQSWFAHVPGLKVVMPSTAGDAKGMLISAHKDDAPVIFIEHRWLYNTTSEVPNEQYCEPLEGARVVQAGSDITLAGFSYMTLECLRASEILKRYDISAEVLDLRCLTPLDIDTLQSSVTKTGAFLVTDTGHQEYGAASEVVSKVCEVCFEKLKYPPSKLALPMIPTPTSPSLAHSYYPRALDIVQRAALILGRKLSGLREDTTLPRDVPDPHFTGPY